MVSFGVGPPRRVGRAGLCGLPVPSLGDASAMLYRVCAALRLARFNCMAAAPRKENQSSDFVGLPVPMAAGAVVSAMYLIIDLTTKRDLNIALPWQIGMAVAMTVVALLMMSRVIYPSFKHVSFEKRGTIVAMLGAIIAVCALVIFPWIAPAVIFLFYLLYGLVVRPFLTRKMRRRIEAEDDEEEEASK